MGIYFARSHAAERAIPGALLPDGGNERLEITSVELHAFLRDSFPDYTGDRLSWGQGCAFRETPSACSDELELTDGFVCMQWYGATADSVGDPAIDLHYLLKTDDGALLKGRQLKLALVSAAQKSFAAARHALAARVSSDVKAALAAATAAPDDEAAGGVGESLDAAWSAAVKLMVGALGGSLDIE